MTNTRDRLASMMGSAPAGAAVSAPISAPVAAAASRQRALLFAPPPAPSAAYLSLLEAEGYDVLLAPDLAAADALLRSAPPQLILAVAPALGQEVVKSWGERAPGAEIRVLPGFTPLLEERLVPTAELLEFTVRALSSLAGLLAATRGIPRERTARTLAFAEAAAKALSFGARDLLAVRLSAALHEVPEALGLDASVGPDQPTTKSDPVLQRQLLAQFAEGLGAPVPIAAEPPPVDASRAPAPEEVVQAAARLALLIEQGDPDPPLSLRRFAAQEKAQLHPAAVEAVLAASRGGPAAKKGTILMAEPDAGLRNLLALRLGNEGYSVRVVPDGRAALEEVRREPPALILAETVLPGLDGYALLDTLNREGKKAVPFVFLSARADSLSVNKGLLLGAADFLGKPVNVEVLLTKLQKLLGQALEQSEVSARISLSDVTQAGTSAYPVVTYDELKPGVQVQGRFLIEADLGEGGMGKVFRARDERLEEVVVLKVMKSALAGDAKVLEHFKREIRLARKITHPGVVRIFDFWEAGPLKFVTMEFLEGTNLRDEERRRGAFPVPVALRVGAELFAALHAAHGVGVVHRDVKPHNVLFLPTGAIKVLDFGIAQGLEPNTQDGKTITTSVMGTPEYMSPEQILGERVDARTDLYSGGVLLYELLTGELPFRGETRMATASMHLREEPKLPSSRNPQIPPAVDALVLRLMKKDRNERHASAKAVAMELAAMRR